VAGQIVHFSTTLGSITPQATTDAEGLATAFLSPNGAVGSALVTAYVDQDTAAQAEIIFNPPIYKLYLALLKLEESPPVLNNGSFDRGPTGWAQLVGDANGKLIYHQAEHTTIPMPVTSPYVAWLGGKASQINRLYQAVTLPKNYAVSLQYWYYVKSYETDCAHDEATVEAVMNGESRTLSTQLLCSMSDTHGWRSAEIELGMLRGATFTIGFSTRLDAQNNSNWFIDSVRLCSRDTAAPGSVPRCEGQ
jgi:hypothetical protein